MFNESNTAQLTRWESEIKQMLYDMGLAKFAKDDKGIYEHLRNIGARAERLEREIQEFFILPVSENPEGHSNR